MSMQEVRVPDLGGADEVEVIELSVSPGDRVELEQSLLVVESDKATVELPSPAAGVLKEFTIQVGAKVKQGDLVAMLETQSGASAEPAAAPIEAERKEAPDKPAQAPEIAAAEPAATSTQARREIVKVPDIGGSKGVTVIEVLVQAGDQVAAEAPLVVLESDKATMEIPAPFAGVVKGVQVKVNDAVDEGTPLLEMEVMDQQASAPVASAKTEEAPKPKEAAKAAPVAEKSKPDSVPSQPIRDAVASDGAKTHAGPAVRKLAREFGVDLSLVGGSGPKHRILKEDVQSFVKQSLKQVAPSAGGIGLPRIKLPDFSQFGSVERRAMSKIHRATAESMQRSWLTVPHVTQFDEADITALEEFRVAQKAAANERGLKLTLMPFLLKACAYALRAYPQFNVSLDTETWEVVQKGYVHIGMAVDTPVGLVVPVIRDVDRKGLWELARESSDLAARARDRKLAPADMQGGCFSISSLGSVGGTAFTPIVNTPEVAILGVSRSQQKPVYENGQFVPRLMLPLSLSYDHRAVNGADAARFTSLLGQLLGDIRHLLL